MITIQEDEDLRELASQIIARREDVAHVELDQVLFFLDLASTPKASARCYSFAEHPIKFFTRARFAIVVYDYRTDYFTPEQMAILIYHELKHIPKRGTKLVDHNVKDFSEVLRIALDWAEPGAVVPDILKEDQIK
ncbi:PhageMetallopep domain-containing protein [Gammaproteobacteria bacterium]